MPERRPMVLEPLRRTVEDARRFAKIVHAGQTDKAGEPYAEHLERVHARLFNELQGLPRERWGEARQIAYLHDVIEDTDYTADDLRTEGFSSEVVTAVHNLSNLSGMPYPAFISGIVATGHLPTLLVKIADVEDNSDPARLALLPAETRARLEKKYGAALPVLKAAAERLGWKEERS